MFLPRGFHIRLQFLGTIFANLILVTHGLTVGWFIVYGNVFDTVVSPLKVPPLDPEEIKWINSSLYIGHVVGAIFLTLMGDVFGRKYTLMILINPQMFGWCLKMLASNATELYIGRFLSGFTAGGSINLIVLFVAELADENFRGRLGTILSLSINIGILLFLIFDIFLPFFEIAFVALAILFIFLCSYAVFPDTPRQLYKIRRKEQAIISLQVYRDIRDLQYQTDNCYQIKMKKIRQELITERGFNLTNSSKPAIKSLIIGLALIILNAYMSWFIIFELTKHQLLNTDIIALKDFRIMIAVCQVLGSILCLILVDLVERKYLLMASVVGITITQIIFEFSGLSGGITNIILIAIATFCFNFGVFPLTFILVPEIIPEKIRIYGVTIMFTLMWVLMFTLTQIESILVWSYEYTNGLVIISLIVFNVICLGIFGFLVPPTRKKSYAEICSSN